MPDSTAALLPGRLTICGIAELDALRDAGVSHVLSLMDPAAFDPPVFAEFPAHRREVLRFHDVTQPAAGYSAPQIEHVEGVLAFGRVLASEGDRLKHLVVHCHMGISRSTAAMAILLAQSAAGREAEAFATVFDIRPRAWPNSRMVAIADRLLGRRGALEAALRQHQRHILQHHPDIADLVASVGRGNELPR